MNPWDDFLRTYKPPAGGYGPIKTDNEWDLDKLRLQLAHQKELGEKELLMKRRAAELDHYMKRPNSFWYGRPMGDMDHIAAIGPTRGHF